MLRLLVRICIVFLWIALIFCALYFPKWNFGLSQEKSINVFTWGDILDPSQVDAFEKRSGIKVHLNYYSSNEELLVKLRATKGEGYDLIIPSDYAVSLLAQANLLQEIKKEKLTIWDKINPALLNHAFDPGNRYSIPFSWEIFGLGIDKDYAPLQKEGSWKMIFNTPTPPYNITMINDPIEVIAISSFYLYGYVTQLNQEQIQGVKRLLLHQKNWVEAYASFRGDYFLATKNCPVVVASSSYIWRTMRQFPFVRFLIPQEGTFIAIENLCIPAASQKEAAVYDFINFLFEPTTVAAHYRKFGFFPASMHSLDQNQLDPQERALIFSSREDFQKFHFIRPLMPDQQMRDLWVEIKSSHEL